MEISEKGGGTKPPHTVEFTCIRSRGRIVKASQNVLVAKSRVLAEIMNILEALPDHEGAEPIVIPDISAEIFEMMVNFMECGKISVTATNFKEIYYAAKKYDVKELIWRCTKEMLELSRNFRCDDVFLDVYEFARRYSINIVKNKIESIFHTIPLSTINKLSAAPYHKRILEFILRSECIECHEYELFEGIYDWLQRVCAERGIPASKHNMRIELGDLFFLIRFPTMTSDQILYSEGFDLLTKDEVHDLNEWMEHRTYTDIINTFGTTQRIQQAKTKHAKVQMLETDGKLLDYNHVLQLSFPYEQQSFSNIFVNLQILGDNPFVKIYFTKVPYNISNPEKRDVRMIVERIRPQTCSKWVLILCENLTFSEPLELFVTIEIFSAKFLSPKVKIILKS
ncbi:hypothetical protein DMENIID0001_064120 [Sergentomyia squamirostris]